LKTELLPFPLPALIEFACLVKDLKIYSLTAKRLAVTETEARSHRRKLLDAHLRVQGSGTGLRERVKEALGELSEPSSVETEMAAIEKADELLESDPLDSTHLFFEELRRIGRGIREVEAGDLTEEDLDSLMPLLDQLGAVLHRIDRRWRQKHQEHQRVTV
jgi:uncharacterized membrane protein YgaE (UPF0421/DUF939 family)